MNEAVQKILKKFKAGKLSMAEVQTEMHKRAKKIKTKRRKQNKYSLTR